MEAHKIQAQNLVKIYGRRKVVDGLSMEMSQGEVVGILAPTALKTTTLHDPRPSQAEPGQSAAERAGYHPPAIYRRARLGLGYLAQAPSIFAKLSVRDNIMAILQTLKISRQERKERLKVRWRNLTSPPWPIRRFTRSPERAPKTGNNPPLVTKPTFIFMDEPFAGVDPSPWRISRTSSTNCGKNIGVMLTDHNVIETLKIVNRAYIIFEGKIIVSGSSLELINDEKAKKLYLGERFLSNPFEPQS